MIETRISYIKKLPNGIIRVETKEDVELHPDDLDENFRVYKKLFDTTAAKALFLIVCGEGGVSNIESRLKFADPERGKIKKAEAFVVVSLPHRIESNFYKRFNKPNHPVEIFSTEAAAVKWLLSFNKS